MLARFKAAPAGGFKLFYSMARDGGRGMWTSKSQDQAFPSFCSHAMWQHLGTTCASCSGSWLAYFGVADSARFWGAWLCGLCALLS